MRTGTVNLDTVNEELLLRVAAGNCLYKNTLSNTPTMASDTEEFRRAGQNPQDSHGPALSRD